MILVSFIIIDKNIKKYKGSNLDWFCIVQPGAKVTVGTDPDGFKSEKYEI